MSPTPNQVRVLDPGDCPTHPGMVEVLAEHRRRLDVQDRHDGRVLAEIASLTTAVIQLDRRLDKLAENQASLATSLLASGRAASAGGLLAGTGGGLVAVIEFARWAWPAIAHWMGW